MDIIPIPAFYDNYIWLLRNDEKCICVDPGDARPVLQYLNANQLLLAGIVTTHHHHDHVGGVNELLSYYANIPVYGPYDDRIAQITIPLKEGDSIELFGNSFDILEIPGHTSTHIAYYNPTKNILFCGDTLFSAGCGRVFDGTMKQLYESLSKINQLPIYTKIYCAHEYTLNNCRFAHTIEPNNEAIIRKINSLSTTPNHCSLPSDLKTEHEINPFLRAISQTLTSPNCNHLSGYQLFKKLRSLKDNF